MGMRTSMAVSLGAAAITIAWITPAWATRCAKEVEKVETAANRLIDSQAGYGVIGQGSTLSTLGRQAPPGSRALPEAETGGISVLSQVFSQLAKARDLDVAGDQLGCIMAVKSAQRDLDRGF